MTAAAERPEAPKPATARRAMITGITGQDGAYLTRLLQAKGYEVIGTSHRSSPDRSRLRALDVDPVDIRFVRTEHPDDLRRALADVCPAEVYHLASLSSVAESLTRPVETVNLNGMSALYFLEAIRSIAPETRFFYASSSEIYGVPTTLPQTEEGPFWPTTAYGVAKLVGHHTTRIYRESYGLFAVSGILFNHESPIRGLQFVTAKICHDLALAVRCDGPPLALGNLDARRDWGFAGEYVEAMWLSLQARSAADYVIASGESHTVREFVEEAGHALGVTLAWSGTGTAEKAQCSRSGRVLVEIDDRFFRTSDNPDMRGSPQKAFADLGWKPRTRFSDLVRLLVGQVLTDIDQRKVV